MEVPSKFSLCHSVFGFMIFHVLLLQFLLLFGTGSKGIIIIIIIAREKGSEGGGGNSTIINSMTIESWVSLIT